MALIQPHARGAHQALGGRPPFPIEATLRIHCLQLWWNLSDPDMEDELHERPPYRRFARLDGAPRVPDETTILRFRHLLEKHELASQVMAVIIAALSSAKNQAGERAPEMQAHIGVDAESGLVHTVIGTAANVNDVTQAGALLHGEEIGAVAGEGRATQGQPEGQDRTSFPSDQAAVRIRQGTVSRPGQEHRAPGDDVRAGQYDERPNVGFMRNDVGFADLP